MADTLRIVHVSNSYTPYKGGVVSSLQATLEALRRLQHETLLITFDFGQMTKNGSSRFLYSPFRFTYKENILALPWFCKNQIKRIIEQFAPDIIHVHHPFLLGPAALSVARAYKIPLIFTYHTRYEDYLHYVPLPHWITKPMCTKLIDAFCENVDAIIAPSCQLQQELMDRYSTRSIAMIPSPLLPIYNQPYCCKKQNKKRFNLISVSRFVPEKNINFLVQLMTLLPSSSFTLTLVGYGWYQQVLQRFAYTTLGLSCDAIVFKKVDDKQELMRLYQEADLFLFASLTETQGLVLAEAMACSTPVVALQGPGQREILKHGYNGFLVESLEEMTAYIQYLYKERRLLEQLNYNAWKTAQRYQLIQFGNDLLAMYQITRNNFKISPKSLP